MAADTTTATSDAAKAACQDQKQGMGTLVFKKTYGVKSTSKAMAACIAKAAPVVAAATENAAQACKTERAADATAFNEKYGTNKNKKNAFGKCVSSKAQETVEEETEARVDAAAACKTERDANADAFKEKYGTNKNKKNAFGKCVSALAKAQNDDGDDA
jgi:hypothetical protein